MNIVSPRVSQTKAAATKERAKPADKEEGFWRELGHDAREYFVELDQESVEDIGNFVKSAGGALKSSWTKIRDIPELPIVEDVVGDKDKEKWSDLALTLGQTVGYTAAAGHGLSGAVKFIQGHKRGDKGRLIDGLVDAATATVIAASVAGLGLARAVAAPIAASLNVFKGGYNAKRGFKEHDGRKQLQGALDATRSLGSFGRMLGSHAFALRAVGVIFAPIAGALQVGRGFHDVANGLRNDDNKKQVKGLADVASALGTTLAFASGAAVIPGIALAVAANLVKVGYQLSPKFRGKVDKFIDKAEPRLQRVTDRIESLSKPIRKKWRKLMGRLVKNVDAERPAQFSEPKLAEIVGLLFADDDYSRDEERRLRVALESAGQKDQLPGRDSEAPPLKREALATELSTPESRRDFMKFMLVVADYDWTSQDSENAYIDGLADHLNVDAKVMEALREERKAESDKEMLMRDIQS